MENTLENKSKYFAQYWEQIYEQLKNVDCNDPAFGLASGFRIAMIQTVCEEELKLNS